MCNSKQSLLLLCLGVLFPVSLCAQKSLTVDDLTEWKRITERAVSDNGKYVAAAVAPWEGDATVRLYDAGGRELDAYTPADKFAFSASSRYLLVTQTPAKSLTDSLKQKKTKADKMPMNTLIIRPVAGGGETVDSLQSHKLAESADWLAYQRTKKDSALYVRPLDLAGKTVFSFPAVTEYQFAKKSGMLYFVSVGDTLETKAGLYVMNPEKGKPALVKEGKGTFKQIAFDEEGDGLAFLYCEEKDSAYKSLELWLSEKASPARLIAGRTDKAFPTGWVISEHGEVSFSQTGSRLFFGTSPEPKQKDTTLLADAVPRVQVWNWNEPVQYTVQTFNREKDLKKSYRAVYNRNNQSLLQLADKELPEISLSDRGDGVQALLSASDPYSLSSTWEGRTRHDYYTVSLETGERKLLKKAEYASPRFSPKGKYLWWYAETDSSWYTFNLSDGKEHRLTTPLTFPAWNEDFDTPDYPNSHGSAGWTDNDQHILLYDRYDIWQFDPSGATPPVNLTVNGRTKQMVYRLVRLDKEAVSVDWNKPQLLTGFDEIGKGSGYYSAKFSKPAAPKTLAVGNYKLSAPLKAKHSDAILYTSETYEQYPDLLLSDLSFKKSVRLTHEGDQQQGIRWGTAEIVTWTSLDGKPLEGVVYKPAGFDPNKKYPLMVNFYERNAETLHSYRMPEPHRSTVDYHLYNSNGYIVFNPDIRYTDGHPGESCYNSVMPGIAALIEKGYVNEKAIAAQGHSWGGYQVAYLATRTDLFAAIESGAPVVNMFSAYGGIRWGSGLNRSFQYEHTQSRIGGTPWTAYDLYVENSPLFTMDKVTTPILIMHNDADGHVPWYQGIEYFNALRRLQKSAWLLNYTGEPHWPLKMANRIDFQKRMLQFFNHYLKNEPAPKWMKEGIPAVEQEFDLGY
ncbi:Prolyl oligopeptidase family protein [Bacteroidales bacterium Barb6]|nr:Prolyl oligopeptidase family protein [Bacteroidales bacterium Barb6]